MLALLTGKFFFAFLGVFLVPFLKFLYRSRKITKDIRHIGPFFYFDIFQSFEHEWGVFLKIVFLFVLFLTIFFTDPVSPYH